MFCGIQKLQAVRSGRLDINKVKRGEQEEINDPELTEIPHQYRPFLKYHTAGKTYDFTQHGTLVYWKNCDNVKPKTMTTLNEKLEFALGRKFRHLITNGTHNIRLITIGHEDSAIDVLPNDPLFLMKPNYVLGNPNDPANISERANINCTEPIFTTYGENNGEVIVPIPYLHSTSFLMFCHPLFGNQRYISYPFIISVQTIAIHLINATPHKRHHP